MLNALKQIDTDAVNRPRAAQPLSVDETDQLKIKSPVARHDASATATKTMATDSPVGSDAGLQPAMPLSDSTPSSLPAHDDAGCLATETPLADFCDLEAAQICEAAVDPSQDSVTMWMDEVESDAGESASVSVSSGPVLQDSALQQKEFSFSNLIERISNPIPDSSLLESQTGLLSLPEPGEPTEAEKRIRRQLADLPLGDQYRKLADRVRGYLPSNVASTLAWAGVDHESHLAEVLTHVGPILADAKGLSVLLVDGNLAEKSLTEHFALENRFGLCEVFRDRTPWREVITASATPRLHVLPAGRGEISIDPLAHRAIPEFLDELKQNFQVVLIDCGKYDGRLAGALVRWADAAYCVVRLGRHAPQNVLDVFGEMQEIGSRLIGCVLTNAPLRR